MKSFTRFFLGSVLLFVFIAFTGCSSDDDSKKESGSVDDDTNSSADLNNEVSDKSTETTDSSDSNNSTDSSESPDTENEVPDDVTEADPYDFAKNGPWHQCPDMKSLPAETKTITAFDKEDQYVVSWEEVDKRRKIRAEVDFPTDGEYQQIGMIFELACHSDGSCDHWDRPASISIIDNPGTDNEELIELLRYATPYNMGMCNFVDVTHLASKLKGKKTIWSFIDTWVGPEIQAGNGHGWNVTVKFVFFPGKKQYPDEVIYVGNRTDNNIKVGSPEKSVDSQFADKTVTVPADAKKVEARFIMSGHGQGNMDNCAEFCQLDQIIKVNSEEFVLKPYREDCDQNPVNTQQGTWQHPRHGWCPGAVVNPMIIDITDAVKKGEKNTVSFNIHDPETNAPYLNSCRPGGGTGDPETCEGCMSGNSAGNCEYDNAGHTEPYEMVSIQLLIYK